MPHNVSVWEVCQNSAENHNSFWQIWEKEIWLSAENLFVSNFLNPICVLCDVTIFLLYKIENRLLSTI
jgi:hypothetical protein